MGYGIAARSLGKAQSVVLDHLHNHRAAEGMARGDDGQEIRKLSLQLFVRGQGDFVLAEVG